MSARGWGGGGGSRGFCCGGRSSGGLSFPGRTSDWCALRLNGEENKKERRVRNITSQGGGVDWGSSGGRTEREHIGWMTTGSGCATTLASNSLADYC